MIKQSLSGNWQFRQCDTAEWFPATVPGCIHTDLIANGKIPDPFIAKNELDVKWVPTKEWEYLKEFEPDQNLLQADKVMLVCEGLDTLAQLTLNGKSVGNTDNMFRTYQWDVKSLMSSGKNTLHILFHSPMQYIQAQQSRRPLPKGMTEGIPYIRKVQSHFGWDWGPTLPTSGIWQEISLQGQSTARITEVLLNQVHENERVTITVESHIEQWQAANLTLDVSLRHPDGHFTRAQASVNDGCCSLPITIESPELWWPNGLGSQPLYQVEIQLRDGKAILDSHSYQIGLRKLELLQQPDEWGKTFTFVVNGVPIFAKGADWIPADSFINRVTHAQLEHMIRSCALANMNMLRVWGGGFYESKEFYDLCDHYGILIWQDCGFACALYPLDTPEFLNNVNAEIRENVRRLRHHACLALWCGNNEIEMMSAMWKKEKQLIDAYEKFFHHTLPQLISEEDPGHPYWPSSPSSNTFQVHTNSDATGDTHLWHVWHGLKPFNYFRQRYTRFCSEFGLESLPTLPTIASFAQPADYSLKSSVFLHHQRSLGGNDKMLYYLTTRFRIPAQFSDMVYLTQIMQAECMRIATEHWRRNRPRCSGALYWQLNDCWPVSSWASIDYYGRWKALQYAARRFNAPIAISIEEKGTQVTLHVANDTQQEVAATLQYDLQTFDGKILWWGEKAVSVPANLSTSLALPNLDKEIRDSGKGSVALVAKLQIANKQVATQVMLFALEKYIKLPDPDLKVSCRLENDSIVFTVTAKKLARFVEFELTGTDVIFSDNFFDLPANTTREIRCPLPNGWTLERVEKSVRVHSLAEVRPAGNLFSDRLEHYRSGLTPISISTRFIFSLLE